jgi:hypothetical protein
MRVLYLLSPLAALILTAAAVGQGRPSGPGPNIHGTWYLSGAADTPCRVDHRGQDQRALFTNERNESAQGTVFKNRVRVPAWDDPAAGGLSGVIRGDTILWSNGTYWTRWPIFDS